MSITSRAWEVLDRHLSLSQRLANGESVNVTADTIRSVTRREPRLMTKFDARAHRPSVLRNATILPIENGRYVILPGDGYHDVELASETKRWDLSAASTGLKSLPWDEGPSSESQLIDMAYAGGLLEDFLEEANPYLTIRGRLRTSKIDFTFPTTTGNQQVTIDGVQVEVDAGYEGNFVNLIEAKLGKRKDFHIRQIYYPLRMWQERVPQKSSRTLFVAYSDRVVSFRLYDFTPTTSYGGISLVKSMDYVVDSAEDELSLVAILTEVRRETAPLGVTFPQADDMAKVLDLVDATAAGVTSIEGVTDRYGFSERQALYYPTAARYLGFIESGTSERVLTDLGRTFATSPRVYRHKLVLMRLAALPVFRDALEFAVGRDGELPPAELVAEWIRGESFKAGLPLTGSTPRRRAATVRSWTQWALDVVDS